MIYGSLGDLTSPVYCTLKEAPGILDSIFLFAKLSFSNMISVIAMSYTGVINAYRPKLMGHAFE